MGKNLLSDTDFTRGHDTRFANAVTIGYVTKIECTAKHANVRVVLLDKKDHTGQPLITKPIPVLQACTAAKKSYAIPRIDAPVALFKLANGTSDYFCVGAFYTSRNPPPVTDPKLDYTIWEGGHTQQYDANTNNDGTPKSDVFLTQDFKAGWKGTFKKDVNLNTTDAAKFNVQADGDILIKSANGNIDVKSPTGTVTIEQDKVVLSGTSEIDLTAPTIKINGHVLVQGNIDETGIHLDSNGHHTNTRAMEERLATIEARVAKLEATLPMKLNST